MENKDNEIIETITDEAEEQTYDVIEFEGMPTWKANILRAIPLVITLACIGLFALGVKLVAGIFYQPEDTLYERTDGETVYAVVHCYQNPSNTYYIYEAEGFEFLPEEYEEVGSKHEDAHFARIPEAYFILNESALDVDRIAVKKLCEGNGLAVFQFDEFVLYRLEGQYGVFAPLRDYEQSTTSRKNDLYVIRQLMKNDRYLGFELPDDMTSEDFLAILEKLEWHLDTEYIEDN